MDRLLDLGGAGIPKAQGATQRSPGGKPKTTSVTAEPTGGNATESRRKTKNHVCHRGAQGCHRGAQKQVMSPRSPVSVIGYLLGYQIT